MNIKHPNLKFYFHTHEKYFPSTFEYVASNSELVVDNQNLGVKSQVELAQYNCDGKDVYINMSHSIKHGMKDLDFPLYYFARNVGEFLYITYFMVYPYNGDYNLILAKTGGHWGDIERLTLEYDKNGNLTRVYFGAHGDKDGRWIEYKDLEIEDNSIVVYIAKNGHGFYPKKGMYFRLYGLANDVTNRGKVYTPYQLVEIPKDPTTYDLTSLGLSYFCGKLGKDGIVSLVKKAWYYDQPEISIKPPPMINQNTYFATLGLITLILLFTLFKLYKTSSNKIIYFTLIILIMLTIRGIILNIE